MTKSHRNRWDFRFLQKGSLVEQTAGLHMFDKLPTVAPHCTTQTDDAKERSAGRCQCTPVTNTQRYSTIGNRLNLKGASDLVPVQRDRLDDLQVIRIGQGRERGRRKSLVPDRHGRHIILQRQIAIIACPSQRLDLHLDISLEAHRIRDVPAI